MGLSGPTKKFIAKRQPNAETCGLMEKIEEFCYETARDAGIGGDELLDLCIKQSSCYTCGPSMLMTSASDCDRAALRAVIQICSGDDSCREAAAYIINQLQHHYTAQPPKVCHQDQCITKTLSL